MNLVAKRIQVIALIGIGAFHQAWWSADESAQSI
jgi:hypothetical protein